MLIIFFGFLLLFLINNFSLPMNYGVVTLIDAKSTRAGQKNFIYMQKKCAFYLGSKDAIPRNSFRRFKPNSCIDRCGLPVWCTTFH